MTEQNGPRIVKLCKALEKAVAMSSKPLPKSHFLKCFHLTAEDEELARALSAVYDSMHQQLQDRVEVSFSEILWKKGFFMFLLIFLLMNRIMLLIFVEKMVQELN